MLLTSLDTHDTSADAALPWPGARAMFDNAFDLTLERRIKYLWRLALSRQARGILVRELRGLTMGEALFRAQPRAFYPLMSHLLDRRMRTEERLSATLASLRTVCDAVGNEVNLRSLLTQGITLLALSDGTRIVLSLNDVSFHEGLWQIGLIGADGLRVYSIGFGCTDAQTLLIGNVQGPSTNDDGLDRIRDATHAAHGMRPPHLLMYTLRLLAVCWGVKRLQGVDPESHIKGRWNLRESRLRFDYRAFWAEHEGVRADAGGNWSLSLAPSLRPLEAVPTKRRAMYRRRYAMLEALQQAVNAMADVRSAPRLTPLAVPTSAAPNTSTLELIGEHI